MPRKRFLIAALDRYPPFRVDITELFSTELAAHYNLHWVMARDDGGPAGEFGTPGERFSVADADPRSPKLLRCWRWTALNFRRLGDVLRGRYDLVQTRDLIYLAPLYALAARLAGVPYAIWMSFPIAENYLVRAKTRLKEGRLAQAAVQLLVGITGGWAMQLALGLAQHGFVQSDEMKRQLVARGANENKLTPVPMGVNTQAFSPMQVARANDPVYAGRRVVLYVGALDPNRQMAVPSAGIARLLAEEPDLLYVLIGAASEAERDVVRAACRPFGVLDRVIFREHMPLGQALTHVRRADVCLAPIPIDPPLLKVATATKLGEYVAMGRRVVANHHPDHQVVIEGSGLGVLCNFTEAGFNDAVARALAMGEPSTAEMQRGFAWVEHERSYARLGAIVAAVYARILSPGPIVRRVAPAE
jgi:glycosyltransferase involved in cell wall biosynthesis